jgi:hypothetical protein
MRSLNHSTRPCHVQPEVERLEDRCVPSSGVAPSSLTPDAVDVTFTNGTVWHHTGQSATTGWTFLTPLSTVAASAVSDGITTGSTGTTSTPFVLFQDTSVWEYNAALNNGSYYLVSSSGAVQVSASQAAFDTVFIRYSDGSVWEHTGTNANTGWSEVWGSGATQISAGVNAAGKPTVFVLFNDGSVWEHNGRNMNTGWAEVWGSGATQVSASQVQADTAFVSFGGDLWEHTGRNLNTGWTLDASQGVASFSTGVDASGKATVFALFQSTQVEEFFSTGSGVLVDFPEGAGAVYGSTAAADTVFVNYSGALWEHVGQDSTTGWFFVTNNVAF